MLKENQENSYTVTCASCGKETLLVKEIYSVIPRFGRVVMISMLCSSCGYRIFDTINLEDNGPKKIEFDVLGMRDLSAKIIRSSTSTVLIPELGLELKPGPKSDAFITNIEGLLDRFLAIAEQLASSIDQSSDADAQSAIIKIKQAMKGELRFRIVVEDEYGNSGIIPPESF